MPSKATEPADGPIRRAVEKLKGKAAEYLDHPEKMEQLIDSAREKVRGKAADKGTLADVWAYLTALVRLLRAYSRKQYNEIPWQSIVLATVAVIYFVNPLDLIPDFIPVAGYVDDAAVVAFVVRQIRLDLDAFIAWESARGPEPEEEGVA